MRLRPVLLLLQLLISFHTFSQTGSGKTTYGIWQNNGDIVNKFSYPHLQGRIFNYKWKDLETSNNVWSWADFDKYIADRVSDSTPVILMIFTKNNAPDWLYNFGVPKVIERDSNGTQLGYCPYFADPEYKFYFERMITTVRQHIAKMSYSIRSWIAGIQGCFGEEGDYIGYRGVVDQKFQLTPDQFQQLFEEFSAYYYNEYKNTVPKIHLMSNPSNNGEDQTHWLLANCPNGWLKSTHIGKEYQANYELDKASWLLDILNKKQSGEYIRGRSELSSNNLSEGWWQFHTARNLFTLFSYMVYWGMDWSNQVPDMVQNPLYANAFNFFNKYAGQKDTTNSTNAMCALRDGLDASDIARFPESKYGTAIITNKTRFKNIANQFATYGAMLTDINAATGDESYNLIAKGINDVGWRIFPGNYERYLHQINPNATSIGYWNVIATADSNSMYGRFARSISMANSKDALYFDVDKAFFNYSPVNGRFPVSIDITYLDKGKGSFALYYDSKTNSNKLAVQATCTNSNTWKKISVTLADAYMGNRSASNSDFYIRSTSNENVIFSLVELAKPVEKTSGANFSAISPAPFDTICYTSSTGPNSFILNGDFLNGSDVFIGPDNGFHFSVNSDSAYQDSLVIRNYGSSLQQTIYVMFAPAAAGSFNKISVKGGGARPLDVPVTAVALNSSPALSANISNVTCNNDKNGAVNLILTGGIAPFSYQWSCADKAFKQTTQDVNALIPADYTVVVTSKAGCVTSATYTITQPAVLYAGVTQDSIIKCKGGATTVTVTAMGGTKPYSGIGSYPVSQGYHSFIVTDKNGCANSTNISVENGTGVAPAKPTSITGNTADATGLCGTGDFVYTSSYVAGATSYTWITPAYCTIKGTQNNGKTVTLNVTSKFANGMLGVSAVNSCGASNAFTKDITSMPRQPDSIAGQISIAKFQKGLVYKVLPAISGLKYFWTVPNDAFIVLGQNTPAITVNWGSGSGKVQVQAQNNCGSSLPANLYVGVGGPFANAIILNNERQATGSTNTYLQPNPANSTVYLTIAGTGNFNIRLYDIAGKLLWKKDREIVVVSTTEKIDLFSYANGLYLVTVVNDKGFEKTIKLLKQ